MGKQIAGWLEHCLVRHPYGAAKVFHTVDPAVKWVSTSVEDRGRLYSAGEKMDTTFQKTKNTGPEKSANLLPIAHGDTAKDAPISGESEGTGRPSTS